MVELIQSGLAIRYWQRESYGRVIW